MDPRWTRCLDAAAGTIERILQGCLFEARVARMAYAPTGETLVASLTREDLARKIVGTLQVVVLLLTEGGVLRARGLGLRGHTLASPVERTAEVIATNPEILGLAEPLWAEAFDAARFGAAFSSWVERLVEGSLRATQKVYEHRMRWEDDKPQSSRDVGRRISSGFPIVEATAFNASAARMSDPEATPGRLRVAVRALAQLGDLFAEDALDPREQAVAHLDPPGFPERQDRLGPPGEAHVHGDRARPLPALEHALQAREVGGSRPLGADA